MARICIILASATLLFFGLLHLHGIFFTTDLDPKDIDLVARLKSSTIRMDEAGIFWDLWIGFNAMFGVGLAFIGAVNLYLAVKHFQFLADQYFIPLLTIASNVFFIWTGVNYMIPLFVLSMSIPLLLFVTAFIFIQYKALKRPKQPSR